MNHVTFKSLQHYIYHAVSLVCIFPHSLLQCDQIANEMTDDERTNPEAGLFFYIPAGLVWYD